MPAITDHGDEAMFYKQVLELSDALMLCILQAEITLAKDVADLNRIKRTAKEYDAAMNKMIYLGASPDQQG